MLSRTHGSVYPKTGHHHALEPPQKPDPTSNLAVRVNPAPRKRQEFAARERIDAQIHVPVVLHRVESAADELGVRCGTRVVLEAVLHLLGRWKVVRDNRVRLYQVLEYFPADARKLTLKSVSRNLKELHALELIDYRPAVGRSSYGVLAIHPRFLDGITALKRDEDGRVIARESTADELENVPFSRALTICRQSITSLPSGTDDSDPYVPDTRPTRVGVPPKAIQRVLHGLPETFSGMTDKLRWKLGAAVGDRLKRGWTEEQILANLAAPMPEGVRDPGALGIWRLRHNMIGAGPVLAKVQRTYDELIAQRRRSKHESQHAQAFVRVCAELPPHMIDALAQAATSATQAKFGAASLRVARESMGSDVHFEKAVVQAVRMAKLRHPGMSAKNAAKAWLDEQRIKSAAFCEPAPREDQWWMQPGGGCVDCGNPDAPTRTEMPLPTPLCEDCWDRVREEFQVDLANCGHVSAEDEILEGACA